jgi:potassium-transporting ATPase KdpC subunit
MKKNLLISLQMTAVTTILLGLIYPLAMTALAQWIFPDKANGQIMVRNGEKIGSRIIGQPFTGPGYFHSRPSNTGDYPYNAANSGGSNLGPTNATLIKQVNGDAAAMAAQNPRQLVPIDLVTSSASGLDPDISPAAAYFQVPRVAKERKLAEDAVRNLVTSHIEGRQLGFLGEPRVNVLELNLALETLR